MEPLTIQPNRNSFVLASMVTTGISIIFAVLVLVFFEPMIAGVVVLLTSLLLGLRFWLATVRYKKAQHHIYSDTIVGRTGGLFSDKETKLALKNTTQVTLRYPFLQNKLFGTGNVVIKSAGSSFDQVAIVHIKNADEVYTLVQRALQRNGFSLQRSQLIQSEKPSPVAVVLDIVGYGFFLAVFIGPYILNLLALLDSWPVYIILFLGLGGFVVSSVFRFLDLAQRRYDVYNDAITYSEGFLTKVYSVIPIENLSDSSTKQNFIDQILGLYDVMISCQGAGQEIHFKNMKNGVELEQNIDQLIRQHDHKATTQVHNPVVATVPITNSNENAPIPEVQVKPALPKQRSLNTEFTSTYKMNAKRTIASMIISYIPFFLLVPLVFIEPYTFIPLIMTVFFIFSPIIVRQIIALVATTYVLKSNSVETRYKFLSTSVTEFSSSKITGVIVHENFIDRWLKTYSIEFRSIGSTRPVVFKYINNQTGLVEVLLAKAGISLQHEEDIYQVLPQYTFVKALKANLVLVALLVALLFALIFIDAIIFAGFSIALVLITMCIHLYKKRAYSYQSVHMTTSNLVLQTGYLFKKYHYALLDNIKDIETLQYPFGSDGNVNFNIAGDVRFNTQRSSNQQQQNSSLGKSSFTLRYLPNIHAQDDLIDIIFHQRPNASEVSVLLDSLQDLKQQPIIREQHDWRNGMVIVVILHVILLPGLLILPLSVWYLIVLSRAKKYSIESYRVVAHSGILYKKQLSILFSKIDHISQDTGALNKLFNNGNVSIYTTGSSTAELTVSNVPNYVSFYQKLESKL